MNHTPRFSVIIPAYNYGHYLPRALDSVLAQTGDDYEIVVVDDGSVDSTVDVVRRYKAESARPIMYFFQENRGLSAARNQGVNLSRGTYVLFLDADDALTGDALVRFRSCIAEHGDSDFIVGGRIWIDPSGRARRRCIRSLTASKKENFSRYLRGSLGKISPGCLIVHRRVFDCIRFPEGTRIGEDKVFNAHLLALYNGGSFQSPVVTLFRHPNSLSQDCQLTERDRLKTVDLLFDPSVLPPELMTMRKEFLSLTHLGIFTFFYRRGMYQNALPSYYLAIRTWPMHILKMKYFRKYLRATFGLLQMHAYRPS